MAIPYSLKQRFTAARSWLRTARTPRTVEMPSRIIEADAPRIQDGLDYGQPISLPGYKRAALEQAGTLDTWLKESIRDTYNFQFDTPGRGRADAQILPINDDPLVEWNWTTRQYVLSNCHAAYDRNPIAKRAVDYMASFVVGAGFNLSCKNELVKEALNAFIDDPDNAIREYERQAPGDLLQDGELMLRYFTGTGDTKGQIVVVPLRPYECQYIHTEPGFFRRPLFYHFQPYGRHNTDDPNVDTTTLIPYDVPAADMQHVAINRRGYELRGRPELFSALPWLRSHKEWLENRARQNHWRGALLWVVNIAAALPSVIASKLSQYSRPPTPGSTVVASDKEKWTALNNPVGASDAGEDGRQLKIMALNGIGGIPEYMTGDGQNANLATTKSQQLPVLMTFGRLQTILIEQCWYPMFRRVLQAKIDAGLLPAKVQEQASTGADVLDKDGQPKWIDPLKAFDVSYEPLGEKEPFTLAQAMQIGNQNGWVSKRSASTEMGFDYDIEQEQIAREQQADRDAQAQGLIPPTPGQTPPGYQPAPNDANADDQTDDNADDNATPTPEPEIVAMGSR